MQKMTVLVVLGVLAGCSIYGDGKPAAVDAGVAAPADAIVNTCGQAPRGPEWTTWTPTYEPTYVTLTRADYEQVLAFRDKALSWMACREYYDSF